MMRIVLGIAAAILLCGCAARQLDPRRSLSGQTTMVGCLAPGKSPREFVLTDRGGGTQTVVAGHPRLAAHAANHAVKIVGILEREPPRDGLKAIRIEHIAGSCSPPF